MAWWKFCAVFFGLIVLALAVTLITCAIMAHVHNVEFFAEMQDWFTNTSTASEAIKTSSMIFIK